MECQVYRRNVKDSHKSIVGYEEHNPIDDSTLTAMFEDLQEGTLLSTLNNHVFLDVVNTDSKASWIAQDIEMVEQSITGNFNLDSLFENTSFLGCQVSNEETPIGASIKSSVVMDDENGPSKVGPSENSCSSSNAYKVSLERGTFGSPSGSEGDELSPAIGLQQQLDCIHHDHCYTMKEKESGNQQSSSRSACSTSSDSPEEGTNSDGGEVEKQLLKFKLLAIHSVHQSSLSASE